MKGGKKKRQLLHERALLMKEHFRIQRNLFNSLKPKILYLPKKKKIPKTKASRTSLTKGDFKEKSQKKGGQKA